MGAGLAGTNSGALQLNVYSQTIASLSTSGTGTANAVIGGTSTANSSLEIRATSPQTYTGTLGGTGAVIDGNHTNCSLLGFAMTQAGSSYSSAPTVSIQGGSASATANLTSVTLAANSSIGGSGDLTIHAPVSGAHGLTKEGHALRPFHDHAPHASPMVGLIQPLLVRFFHQPDADQRDHSHHDEINRHRPGLAAAFLQELRGDQGRQSARQRRSELIPE